MEARFFIFRGGAKNMLDQTMEIACFEKNALCTSQASVDLAKIQQTGQHTTICACTSLMNLS